MRRHTASTLLAACGLMLLLIADAWAQHHDDRHGDGWHGAPPPPHAFNNHDRDRWREGEWRHVEHNGHFGWWWTVGPEWYPYASPVYPYPNPYVPPVVAAPRANMWYYCGAPPGYYPYVAQCSVPWQVVAPQPPG